MPEVSNSQLAMYRQQADAMAERFTERFKTKFVEGGMKHGGDMLAADSSRDMLIEAENEVLDQWAYLQALRIDRERLRSQLKYETRWREQVQIETENLRNQLAEAVARNRALVEKYEGV